MVTIRFYEELNDFLPKEMRKRDIVAEASEGTTTKKLIEDLGVPHTEVDLVLVNGDSVDFSYKLRSGDRISVYPVFESFDVQWASRVRSQPLRECRFILDVHLGKLAGALRMLGFDTRYSNTYDDEQLVGIAVEEKRIILTRDREMLKRRVVTHGYCVRSKRTERQIVEVIKRFHLEGSIKPFSRCLRCNVLLVPIEKQRVSGKVPPFVEQSYKRFWTCGECGRIYWKGTHWEHMRAKIQELLQA
jgi:uncharacterized protein with PIN domain/sulfur carrier protein ThiS